VLEAPNLLWQPNAASSCAGSAWSSPNLPTPHHDSHLTSRPFPPSTMEPAILLFGTCDTKLPQLLHLRSQILSHGHQVLLADVGRTPCDSSFIDTPASHFLPAGISISHLPRNELITAMTSYFTAHIKHLYSTHRISGAISLGGSGGTTLAASAMRAALPIGFPKLIVTTMASGDVSCYVGDSDITLMPSIVDIAGSNEILTRILSNAAGAISGMASSYNTTTASENKKAVAITMFGVTTPAVTAAQQVLEASGYETLILHATGSGGRVLERLVREHRVQGVLDITTTELADELFGGVLSAGPDRLTAAAETGTPQIVSVGALDCINFGPKETVPQRFQGEGRNIVVHNPSVTLVRTTAEECKMLGKHIGEKLRRSKGKTEVWYPGKGVSMLSQEGCPFFDPEADRALAEALRSALEGSKVVFRYFPDVPLNDPKWAGSMAQRLIELMEA
jgi:uncharacterized protein (UPF0261 family)